MSLQRDVVAIFFNSASFAMTGRQGVEEKWWTHLERWVGQCLWLGRLGSFRRWRWWLASWRGGPSSRVSPLARRAPSRRKWCSPSGGKLCAYTGTRLPVQPHSLQVSIFKNLPKGLSLILSSSTIDIFFRNYKILSWFTFFKYSQKLAASPPFLLAPAPITQNLWP